jgi:hypothetical protein
LDACARPGDGEKRPALAASSPKINLNLVRAIVKLLSAL